MSNFSSRRFKYVSYHKLTCPSIQIGNGQVSAHIPVGGCQGCLAEPKNWKISSKGRTGYVRYYEDVLGFCIDPITF